MFIISQTKIRLYIDFLLNQFPAMRQARMGNCCNFSACGRMNIQKVTAPTSTQTMLTM